MDTNNKENGPRRARAQRQKDGVEVFSSSCSSCPTWIIDFDIVGHRPTQLDEVCIVADPYIPPDGVVSGNPAQVVSDREFTA